MARARHRTTYKLDTSKPRSAPDSVDWLYDFDESALDTASVPEKYRKVEGETVVEMTEAEKVAFEKPIRRGEIDSKTGDLVAAGFIRSTRTLSLSTNAQVNWASLHIIADNLTYPYEMMSQDDTQTLSIPDAATMRAICEAGIAAAQSARETGVALKDSINAASTLAELAAVEDGR